MTKPAHKHCPECGTEIPIKRSENGTTYIGTVIDESGSMASCVDETIRGFNRYVESLKQEGVKGVLTLTKFNSYTGAHTVYSNKLLRDVPRLNRSTYRPDNATPLYDAIGQTIKKLDEAFSDKVIMVIITDGLENASVEYNQQQVRELIEARQDRGWTFVYLGANQDSWASGQSIGIWAHTISNYDPIHMDCAFGAAATMTSCYASSGDIGQSASATYDAAVSGKAT